MGEVDRKKNGLFNRKGRREHKEMVENVQHSTPNVEEPGNHNWNEPGRETGALRCGKRR